MFEVCEHTTPASPLSTTPTCVGCLYPPGSTSGRRRPGMCMLQC